MRWIVSLMLVVTPCLLMAADAPLTADGPIPPAPAALPLKLEDCVALALASHPQLVEARARIDEAHGSALQAGLYPNPRIDSGSPQIVGPRGTSVYSEGLTQEIVLAGKLKLNRAAAIEATRQTEWDAVRKRFDVLTAVRQEFFMTLAAQRRRTLLEKLLLVTKQSEKTSIGLFNAEQVSETDVLLLRVERRRAETSLQSAEIVLEGRRRQLAATLGTRNLKISAVEGSLAVPVTEFDDEQVLMQVVQSSPLVQIANLDVNRTLLLLRRAQVEWIPNPTIQGGAQYSAATANYQGLVGVYVDIPLWNKNQGNILAANAAVRRASATREIVQQDLTRQLADALARFRSAERAVKNYEEGIIPDAMRTLDLVQKAYGRGQFEISRLLQTQRSVFETNIEYISALESRLLSAAEIAGLLQLEEFP